MSDFAPTPQGLIEALDDFAMHVGGDRYFTEELDGAGQGREFIVRGGGESFVSFMAHRSRDEDSDEVTDKIYILENGTIGIASALPPELAAKLEYEPDPEDNIVLRDYTSYHFGLAGLEVEVLRTQAYRVDEKFNCQIPIIGKHVVYDDDLLGRFEPVVTRDEETGFAVVEYALPGEADDPERDEFDQLEELLERDTSKVDKTIGTMMLLLGMLKS